MKNESSGHWIKVTWPLLVTAVLLVVLAAFSMDMLSSVRGYVAGEGLYSKAQKDAVAYLLEYTTTRDEQQYQSFLSAIAVPQGDREARLELEKPAPDLNIVRQDFLQALNHPDDIPGMIRLFLRFRHVNFMDVVVSIWAEADHRIEGLTALAEQLHDETISNKYNAASSRASRERIKAINLSLNQLEADFSFNMGETARKVQRLLLLGTLVIGICLTVIGSLISRAILRKTQRVQQALKISEERLHLAMESTGDGLLDWNISANSVYCSPRLLALFEEVDDGIARTASDLLQFIDPQDLHLVRSSAQKHLRNNAPYDIKFRIVTALGKMRWVHLHAHFALNASGKSIRMTGVVTDVTERKKEALDLIRSNRALQMLSRCSEAVIRTENEHDLLFQICSIAVDIGGYRTAWVGYAQDDAAKSITLESYAGNHHDGAFLNQINLSWADDVPSGIGPTGRTIRGGLPIIVDDMGRDATLFAWQVDAQHASSRGGIFLPLSDKSGTFGLLALYSEEVIAVSADEIKLIKEMAADLAFGISSIRADAQIRDQASLLDKAQDAIIVCAMDHRVLFWNKSAERLYGWTQEEVFGLPIQDRQFNYLAVFNEAYSNLIDSGEWSGEILKPSKSGVKLTVETRWTLVRDAAGKPQSILAIDTDISQRKTAESAIEHLAFYDPLTLLPNRLLLINRLQEALTVNRHNRTGALLFIDLDNFKTINDTLGHDTGDLLLQQAALRLGTCVRASDTVARLGGDEFVVMLPGLDASLAIAAAQAKTVGEKILAILSHPYQIAGIEHHGTASIGITQFSNQQDSVGDLLKHADLAMYQAKAAGRNTMRFFDIEMEAEVNTRAVMEVDLRLALLHQEFLLYYQPQMNGDGAVTGAEGLVRWQHPRRGLVLPGEFIQLAEDTGLILPLGMWVLETACAQLATWATQPETAQLILAVNVSVRQFRHVDFVETVLKVLDQSGANPYLLKLEITESLMVDNVEATIAKITALKERGVRFSLDDFGTGYSSLYYLKRLPLDQLKIDQSFVRDILTDPNDAVIAQSIIALASSLGLTVIAEGVETEAQMNFLADHGCHDYQGYLFSKPLHIDQYEMFLLAHNRSKKSGKTTLSLI
ncbi:bifunctional diguanylate cyclase/phosphodiesterase [Glaciimonas sp. GG7]